LLARLRPLVVPLILIVVAAAAYKGRVRKEMVDFGVYRTAATRVIAAAPLYRADDGHYQFKYLPAFAIAVAPLAWTDLETAKVVWFAMSVGLLTALVRWSVRALPLRRRTERLLLWLAVVFMAKFYAHELLLGQTNILLGTLLVAALLAVQIDLPRLAGVLIGLAAFVKPYAIVLLPWLLVSHGAAAAGASALVIAAGLALPALIYGWTGNLALLAEWYRTVTTSTTPNLLGADNISLAAMWAKWIGPSRLATALATISSGMVVALAGAVWARRRQVESPDYLEYALLMILIPLLSPQGWDYVLLLGTPAVVIVLDRWSEMGRGWQAASGVALALMSFSIFDLMGRANYARFMAWSIVTLAACGAAASVAHLRWRRLG
jgi:hypothetical protein